MLLADLKGTHSTLCLPFHHTQFLEAMLDKGIKEIVRVGGRSKSDKLGPFNLPPSAGQIPDSGSAKRVTWKVIVKNLECELRRKLLLAARFYGRSKCQRFETHS